MGKTTEHDRDKNDQALSGQVEPLVMLPCPFCGGEADTDENIYNSVRPNDWDAYCDNCMVGFTRRTKELAIKAWNKRAV